MNNNRKMATPPNLRIEKPRHFKIPSRKTPFLAESFSGLELPSKFINFFLIPGYKEEPSFGCKVERYKMVKRKTMSAIAKEIGQKGRLTLYDIYWIFNRKLKNKPVQLTENHVFYFNPEGSRDGYIVEIAWQVTSKKWEMFFWFASDDAVRVPYFSTFYRCV